MHAVQVMKLIVFVCVSNTCRSPMCEYLLRDKLQKAGLAEEFTVQSRSLSEAYEPQGSPANEQGQLVMKHGYGIDSSGHRSKLLSADDVSKAYMIIPVKRDLGVAIAGMFSESQGKLKYFSRDIMDPWRQPYPVYQGCARMIDTMVSELLTDITRIEGRDL